MNLEFGGFDVEGFGRDEGFSEDFGAPEEEAVGAQPPSAVGCHGFGFRTHYLHPVPTIEDLLREQDAARLNETDDYQRVEVALKALGADSTSIRMFSRLDKKNEPNYKLLQQGKMQQSDTIAGKLLKRLMGSAEEKQVEKLDVSKMPEFEKVAKYLGPSGTYVQTREDGWFISGAVLKKN